MTRGLQVARVSLPILVLGKLSLRHEGASFHDAELEAVFSEPIPINSLAPRMIVVDEHSQDADFDALVRAELVAVMSQRLPAVTIAALADRAIPYLPIYGAATRGTLRRKIQESARRVTDDLSAFLRYRRADGVHDEPWVEVVQTPEDLDPRGRTQGWQAVARAAEGRRRRPPGRVPGQIPFDFDAMIGELTAGEEPEEEEPREEEAPR